MANPITPYRNNISKIKDDLEKVAQEILLRNSDKILDLIQKGQLGIGVDPFGQPLQHPQKSSNYGKYEPVTAGFWANQTPTPKKPKVAGGIYNFEWTGTTFSTMFLEFKGDSALSILTKDGKQSVLVQAYGDIFNLSQKNNEIVNQVILLPELYKYVVNNLFKV